MQPPEWPIIGTGDFKNTQGRKDERHHCDCRDLNSRIRNRRFWGSIFPPQPKEVSDEKRNKPAVVILFVETPFFAEMTAANEPERTEGEGEWNQQDARCRRAHGRRAIFERDRFQDGFRLQDFRLPYNFDATKQGKSSGA